MFLNICHWHVETAAIDAAMVDQQRSVEDDRLHLAKYDSRRTNDQQRTIDGNWDAARSADRAAARASTPRDGDAALSAPRASARAAARVATRAAAWATARAAAQPLLEPLVEPLLEPLHDPLLETLLESVGLICWRLFLTRLPICVLLLLSSEAPSPGLSCCVCFGCWVWPNPGYLHLHFRQSAPVLVDCCIFVFS